MATSSSWPWAGPFGGLVLAASDIVSPGCASDDPLGHVDYVVRLKQQGVVLPVGLCVAAALDEAFDVERDDPGRAIRKDPRYTDRGAQRRVREAPGLGDQVQHAHRRLHGQGIAARTLDLALDRDLAGGV